MVKPVPTVPVQKFRVYAQDLVKKTKVRQVNWRAKLTHSDVPETTYEVLLPQSRIVLRYVIPRASPDYIALEFHNSDDLIVDSWSVDEPDEDDPTTDEIAPDWRLLRELFMEVHRQATGWDQVLSDVEKALATQGTIGQPPAPSSRK
jgi:hypothetical protein